MRIIIGLIFKPIPRMNINLIKKTLFMILLCPVLVSGVNVTFNVDMSQEDVGNEGPTLWMGFFWPEPGFVMTDDDQDGVWSYTVPQFIELPVWLPLLWGLAGILIARGWDRLNKNNGNKNSF